MPMVSKLTSAFRTLIGSDGSSPSPGPRKRSWASSNVQHAAERDILETPQPKRSKHTHEDVTSPIGKVANWIKRKASTFGENYFFRPIDMQNGYDNHAPSVTGNTENAALESDLVRRPLNRSPKATSTRDPVNEKMAPKEDRKRLANGPDVRRKGTYLPRDKHEVTIPKPIRLGRDKHPAFSGSNGASSRTVGQPRPSDRLSGVDRRGIPSRDAPQPSAMSSSTNPDRPYVSVNQKLFARPPIRPSSVSSEESRTQSTATECVRLDQLQQYEQLLQQFTTTTNVSTFSLTNSLPVRESMHESTRHSAKCAPQESTELGTIIHRPQVPLTKSLHRTRVLPHQYESRREIREAARQRLHAPVTELSPSATPYASRHTVATPAQPDFTLRSESPVILGVQLATERPTSHNLSQMTSLERSLTSTPFAMLDWVKDLKERFESSVRIQHRNAEEEKDKLSVYKQKNDERASRISKKILEDMMTAERRTTVMEEPPTPEISEEEDDEVEEVEEEEELPELTGEMLKEINNALKAQPSGQVLTEGFKLRLTRNDMHTLFGLNWLNDEIINFYMNLLVERGDKQGSTKLHCFNTFFYPKLLKEGQTGLRRWTKRTDIFAKDMILVPIHLGMHWCMAIIDFRKKVIEYFDSMGGDNQNCLDALWEYLVAEHKDKKGSPYNMTGWSAYCRKDIPKQLNGSDCGMFACKFADYASQDKRITFSQHDMPYFRKRMVWELLHKELL